MSCRRTRSSSTLAVLTGELNARPLVRQTEGPPSLRAQLRRLELDLDSVKTAIAALESLQRKREVPAEAAETE